jgi:SAM-dependent methyltransferase
MKVYYDKSKKRLLIFKKKATAEFWDKHWDNYDYSLNFKISKNNRFILDNTRKFLKKGKILEGGCGLGKVVYCLHYNGYSAFGIDFAKKAVKKVNKRFPELNVFPGDVRYLQFKDNFFDGYWSLGVIEHFFEGYDLIVEEMYRVLKKGGFLFLTYPYMSPLRRLKVKLRIYRSFNQEKQSDCFYQFVLNPSSVKKKFEKIGFKLIYSKPFGGLKGFKDEIRMFKPLLQRLYDYRGKNRYIKIFRKQLKRVLNKFSSHMILMTFKKDLKC